MSGNYSFGGLGGTSKGFPGQGDSGGGNGGVSPGDFQGGTAQALNPNTPTNRLDPHNLHKLLATFDVFKATHTQSDADENKDAIHHTLGLSKFQAATGDHLHDAKYITKPGAWTAYVPTLTATVTNPTLGAGPAGHITGKYVQIDKTVICDIEWGFGAGATLGNGTFVFSLPVPSVAYVAGQIIGVARYRTNAGVYVLGLVEWSSVTSITILIQTPGGATPNLVRVTNALPAAQSAGDTWSYHLEYEAA